MSSSSKKDTEREKEDGELSQGDSPMKTPLSKIHAQKLGSLNANNVKDSLQRPRKATKRPAQYEPSSGSESDGGSSKGFENSIIHGLKRSKTDEISLRQTGLLNDPRFMSSFSIPDRRDLKAVIKWMQGLNEIFSNTRAKGGVFFKDHFEQLKMHEESLEMFVEEYKDDLAALDGLLTIQAVVKMFIRILDIHSTSNGLGSKLVATLGTSEVSSMIGGLEASFIISSLRSQSRGASGPIFYQSPYKLATWTVRSSRYFHNDRSQNNQRFENRWPHGGKRKYEQGPSRHSVGKADGAGKNTLPKHKF